MGRAKWDGQKGNENPARCCTKVTHSTDWAGVRIWCEGLYSALAVQTALSVSASGAFTWR